MNQEHLGVEDTNEEALSSKISAVRKGYFIDHYAEEFAVFKGRRDIIMHRGYWARVHTVRRLVESMVKHGEGVQIISLGCGLQTLWFNLMEEGLKAPFRFIELDLEGVVKRKIRKIKKSKKLGQLFEKLNLEMDISEQEHLLRLGDAYALAACDLSRIGDFDKLLTDHKVDTKTPTLFYCECVLSYIEADRVDELVRFIREKFDLAFFFDYEMYNPSDRFGQLMVKNFNQMGCPLVGIYKYPTLEDQHKRYTESGWQRCQVLTMKDIYYECIDKEERQRVEKLQMLDEFEEWNLIMAHYYGLLAVTHTSQGKAHPRFNLLMDSVRLKL